MRIGSHVSISNGLLGAAREAKSYGANAFMIYTGAPQNSVRKPVEQLKIPEGLAYMNSQGMSVNDVAVHAPYIINPANPEPEKRRFAADMIRSEIKRTEAIGAPYFILHPGSNPNREQGLQFAAQTLNEAVYDGQKPVICLETMAGRKNELGVSFEEIRDLTDMLDNKELAGVCFDTCHVFNAGYDIVNGFDRVMEEFDRIVGLSRIHVVHVNGSLHPFGSRKDRHANIGADAGNPKGADLIGVEAIYNIVHSEYLKGRLFILETPWPEDGYNLYKEEIAMLSAMKGC